MATDKRVVEKQLEMTDEDWEAFLLLYPQIHGKELNEVPADGDHPLGEPTLFQSTTRPDCPCPNVKFVSWVDDTDPNMTVVFTVWPISNRYS